MRQKTPIDLLQLKSFLEKEIFNEKLKTLIPFKKGASSFNYLAVNDQKYIVKLAWKHPKEGVERLTKIISTVSHHHLTPALMTPQNPLFCYQGYYGFISHYLKGSSPKATNLSCQDLSLILDKYFLFSQISWRDNIKLIEAYHFDELFQNQLETLNTALNKKMLFHPFFKILLKKIKKEFLCLQEMSLKIQKKVVIHGDFTHNNILKTHNDFFLIDFEDLGFGAQSEDILRFLLAWRARLPIFYPYQQKQQAYLKKAQELFHLSFQEWQVGLVSFILQKTKKIFSQKGLKPRFLNMIKLIKLLYFLKQCQRLNKHLLSISAQ